MPAHLLDVETIEGRAVDVARTGATWTPLASTTSRVYRTPEGIVRIHNQSVPACEVLATARRARLLRRGGVGVCLPVAGDDSMGWSASGLRSRWVDLGPGSQDLDWRSAGQTARALHDVGPCVLSDERLEHLDDVATHRRGLERLERRRVITTTERDVVAGWIGRIEADLEVVRPRLRRGFDALAVVHDDMWPKNFVSHESTGQTFLVDLDGLGLAHHDYDLASVVRATEAGAMTQGQAACFEVGYGRPLPDVDVAAVMGQLHRCRWLLGLLWRRRHCAWSISVSRRLLIEATEAVEAVR